MIVKRKTSNLIGRALRLALCYVFALQAFAAALSTASALGYGPASGIASIICHTSEDGSPPPHTVTPQPAACAVGAVAATAVALPPPVFIAPQPVVTVLVQHSVVPLLDEPPAIRTGRARAPPHFA